MSQEYIQILETTLLLCNGVDKADLMLKYGLGKYIIKAEKIREFIDNA